METPKNAGNIVGFSKSPNPESGIFLTVSYPTYNRATYLRESIESLISVLGTEFLDKVKVLVCDNSDSPDTGWVIRELSERFFINIQYVRNDGNIGSGTNVIRCMDMAQSRYVHVVSDQVKFHSNYRVVLRYLQNRRVAGVINLGYTGLASSIADLPENYSPEVEKYSEIGAVISKFHKNLTHLSSIVYRRDCLNTAKLHDVSVQKSLVSQTHVLFDAVSASGFENIPVVCVRVPPRRALAYDFLDVFSRDFLGLVRKYSPDSFYSLGFLAAYSLWLARMEYSLSYPADRSPLLSRLALCFAGYGVSPFIAFPALALLMKRMRSTIL